MARGVSLLSCGAKSYLFQTALVFWAVELGSYDERNPTPVSHPTHAVAQDFSNRSTMYKMLCLYKGIES